MITIEQIDEFRKRTNSSYEDARFFLERHQGDVLEAIIDFERTKANFRPQEKRPSKGEFGRRLAELIQKGFDLRMTVEDKAGKLLFTVPILLILIMTPAWPMMLFVCLFLILLGYRLGFRDIKTTAVNVREIFDSLGTQMRDVGRPDAQGPFQGHRPPEPVRGQGPTTAAGRAPMAAHRPGGRPPAAHPSSTQPPQPFGQQPHPQVNPQMNPQANPQPNPKANPQMSQTPARQPIPPATQQPIGFVRPESPMAAGRPAAGNAPGRPVGFNPPGNLLATPREEPGQVMTLPPQEPSRPVIAQPVSFQATNPVQEDDGFAEFTIE